MFKAIRFRYFDVVSDSIRVTTAPKNYCIVLSLASSLHNIAKPPYGKPIENKFG